MKLLNTSLSTAVAFATYLSIFNATTTCHANTANPNPVIEEQSDGTLIEVKLHGDENSQYVTDDAGYTISKAKDGIYYYDVMSDSGGLVETGIRADSGNPPEITEPGGSSKSSKKGIKPTKEWKKNDCKKKKNSDKFTLGCSELLHKDPEDEFTIPGIEDDAEETSRLRRGRKLKKKRKLVATVGSLPNLVIPIRFSNHASRNLPTRDDLDILMNHRGPHPLAPTGSVWNMFDQSSYSQLSVDSVVVDWVTVPNNETYYANGNSGLTTLTHTLIRDALDAVDASGGITFKDFDLDDDDLIDAITFLHSGYAAEFGGSACDGTQRADRMWSHKWAIYSIPPWYSSDGVRVYSYHISPGIWGISNCNNPDIGRIGVIGHETGHFLGLPDLYDTDGGDLSGNGIGSHGLMANSWGFSGNQLNPPIMSAWSRIQLGWDVPTEITSDGTYQVYDAGAVSCPTCIQIWKVSHGMPANEFLLIENRQPTGFESDKVNYKGLIIYHIDDSTGHNTQGYPGQAGWPSNGNHYRVAILQADGDYDLEKNVNRGDTGDYWTQGQELLPSIDVNSGPFPNTDSYKGGNVVQTGARITDISASGPVMTFRVSGISLGGTPSPSKSPSSRPSSSPSSSPTTASPSTSPSIAPTPLPPPPGTGTETALFDGEYRVPHCKVSATSCSSGDLLLGRATKRPESNTPNTIDECADGNSGSYQSDESLESILVYSSYANGTADGGSLRVGGYATVRASVFAYSTGTADTADFYYTDDVTAATISWTYIDSLVSPGGGDQVITSPSFQLLSSGTYAVRVRFRWNGSRNLGGEWTCNNGSYDDADDLMLTVVSAGSNPNTDSPTTSPSVKPSTGPTTSPSLSPSKAPIKAPSKEPTQSPSLSPSRSPSNMPSVSPSKVSTGSPSKTPTSSPSLSPSQSPSKGPSISPSKEPSSPPTAGPSASPTKEPTHTPSQSPSSSPSKMVQASDDTAPTPNGTPVTVDVLNNDQYPSGVDLIVTVLANPGRALVATTHGSCEVVDGNMVQYTPTPNFEGQDICQYEVCASDSCDKAMVYVEVGTPSKPVAADDQGKVVFNTPETFDVLHNDTQAENLVLVVANITTQAANGNCEVVPAGNSTKVKYTPEADFAGGDSCVYTACVQGSVTACDIATLTIDVSAAPTSNPTQSPSNQPTLSPSHSPSKSPSTSSPSKSPTLKPVTSSPSSEPTKAPSKSPETDSPSDSPSKAPSSSPVTTPTTSSPSWSPSRSPSKTPSLSPSTANPTTANPTTANPTTANPTSNPTKAPVVITSSPSASPTLEPSVSPSKGPSVSPSKEPTASPVTNSPSKSPSSSPNHSPSTSPTKAPSPVTSNPSLYYTVCGSSSNVCSGQADEADVEEKHEVRCCADTRISNNWKQHANCAAAGFTSIWGESNPLGVCHSQKTFAEAEKICSDAGARLCTMDELLADCPRGTGCSFDKEMNWSSTPVPKCTNNASCDDGKSCTVNTCGNDGVCTAAPIPGCSSKSIVCGSSAGACKNDKVREASPNELHEVRCCANTRINNGWRQHANCAAAGFTSTYGESDLLSDCHAEKTYAQAEKICLDAGGRLCTQAELLADCTRGTGCSFDKQHVWSADEYIA